MKLLASIRFFRSCSPFPCRKVILTMSFGRLSETVLTTLSVLLYRVLKSIGCDWTKGGLNATTRLERAALPRNRWDDFWLYWMWLPATTSWCPPYTYGAGAVFFAHIRQFRGDYLYEIPPGDLPAKYAHKREYRVEPVSSSLNTSRGAV
jgi:hypothetical protein